MHKIDTDLLTNLFLELARIDALSLHERPVNDFILQKIQEWGFSGVEDDAGLKTGGNAGNLVITVKGEGQPTLFLCAHTDTVRPTRDLQPQINDGTISSDGSTILGADNRAGCAILLYLLYQASKNRIKFNSFQVVFTIAEEIGLLGAKNIDWTLVKPERGFVFDCSRLPGDYIATASTAVKFFMDILGHPAHAGVSPEKGINALQMATEVLIAFPVGRVDEETVANIGIIRGGDGTNVVPHMIHIEGEIRSLNDDTIANMVKNLKDSLQAVSEKYGGSFTFNLKEEFMGYKIDEQDELTRHLHRNMKKIGLAPSPQVYAGGSDANAINLIGKKAINLGIGQRNPHANNEHIAIADLAKATELAIALVATDA